jgi:uncharacterized protein (TIGR02147 family)
MDSDYRQMLQQELLRRVARNSQYSLRAFARDLDLSPGFLSGLLAHRKGLSDSRANLISGKCAWSEHDKKLFSLLVRLETTELVDEEGRLKHQIAELKAASAVHSQSEDLQFEFFKIIGEWYHAAILELLALKDAVHKASWLAERLSLPQDVVESSISRLMRVGLLEKDGERWKRGSQHVVVPQTPSECVRSFHRSYLEAAVNAVEEQDVKQRILQTTLVPIAPAMIPKIQTQMHRFATEVIGTAEQAEKEQLYCLSIAFFRVDAGQSTPV